MDASGLGRPIVSASAASLIVASEAIFSAASVTDSCPDFKDVKILSRFGFKFFFFFFLPRDFQAEKDGKCLDFLSYVFHLEHEALDG